MQKNNKKGSSELVSYGQPILSPVVLGSEVTELCQLLDGFYETYSSRHKGKWQQNPQKNAFNIREAFYVVD